MRLRIFVGLIAFLILFSVPDEAVRADSRATGIVQVTSKQSEGVITEFSSLSENEAQYMAVQDGVVVGESTIQLEDISVIIQIKGDPLILLKGITSSTSIETVAADRERVRNLIKGEVIRLDDSFRRGKGLSTRGPEQIIKREYSYVFNGIAARITKEALNEIERHPLVEKVWMDRKVRAFLSESVPLIRANKVWTDLGVTGRGIIVAIVDTGIDYTHPDLGGCLGVGCKVVGGYDFVNNDNDPMDDYGHGTHVAGIVAANGGVKGVAPDAKLMAFKVLNQYGQGSWSDVVAGIERAVDPDGNPATEDGAHVINLSLGGEGSPDDPVSQAVDNAVAAGVVVAVAAGNSGSNYETLGSPGVARLALTVGASDKTDQIASFSSRGPAPLTYQIKPEVLAPGVAITSTVPRGTCSLCDTSGYKALSGTSMATPHVAGSAALLLERYPTWTPDQVKEALMERSVDLGLNVFAQGSGRIDAYASATPSGLGSTANLSPGLDDISQPALSVSKTLNLTNLTASSQTYNLSVQGSFPNGMTVTVSPAILILAGGETKSFTFVLNVDNSLVPNPPNPPYSYEGTIVADRGEETLRIPFAFLKTPILEVTFDQEPWILTVTNRANIYMWVPSPGISRVLFVPEGTYDVIALFGDAATRVLREGVAVSTKTQLNIAKAEAVYPLTIVPIDKDGNPLSLIRSLTLNIFEQKATGVTESLVSFGPITSYHFSSMSDKYLFEASLLENQNPLGGPAYTFHGYARDGISSPITFQNSSSDFKRVVTRHTVDPGVDKIVPSLLLSTRWLSMSQCYYTDPPLISPFREEAYLLPLPYPEFGPGYIKKIVFRNPSSPCNFQDSDLLYVTPYQMAKDKTELNAFLWGEFDVPAFSTTSDYLPSGIGPYSWFGRFDNWSEGIRIRAALGSFVWLFLSQLRDLRPHDPLPYELYKDGTLIKSGSFSGVGNPGWSAIDASIPVSPGAYTLRIPYFNFFMAGGRGFAMMEASFDTQKSDPNPPYLTKFDIIENGEITDIVVSGNGQAVFQVFDDTGIAQVDLFYDAGTGWQELIVTNIGPGEYRADLPSFNPLVSLKLLAVDTSGNSLTYTVSTPTTPADTTPPTPNPMTWATSPYAASSSSISMVATTAVDSMSSPASYYFDFVDSPTGGTGGAASGWQGSTSYTNMGLQPDHQYGYRVKARDAAPTPNETSPSSPTVYIYTLTNAPGSASFSNVTQTSIRANWTGNGNPAGTQYYCENTTKGPPDSGWTTNLYWDSTGLTPGTSYTFRVKARNGDLIETGWTDLGTQSTVPGDTTPPDTSIISGPSGTITTTSATFTFTGSDNVTPLASLVYATYLQGYDSGWSSFSSSTSKGYSNLPDGSYTFQVKAKDQAGNEDPTAAARSFTVSVDTTPPTPNPMTWATLPHQTSTSSISMVATTASDPSPPINYYFEFSGSPTGGGGGTSSTWQSSSSYTDSGLSANHQYSYRVKARDGKSNETGLSTVSYHYTDIETPSGITFGTVTSTSIQAKSTNTPSGLTRGSSGLIIYNSTNGNNAGWKKDNNYWTNSPLSVNTKYGFRAKARNGDGDETSYSSTVNRYTLANDPGAAAFSNITPTSIQANWAANGNPSGTQYYCENTTAGKNSGWIKNTYWNSTGLTCGTYSFHVKAKNGDGVEAGWTSLGTQATPCAADLTETAVSNPPAAVNPGDTFSVTDTVQNQGNIASAVSITHYYLSLDTTKGTGDKLLTGNRSVLAVAGLGGASTGTVTVTVPSATPLGSYYLLACADDTNAVIEFKEDNNCKASGSKVKVTLPDLVETSVNNPPATAAVGSSFSVTDTAKNQGLVQSGPSMTRYYLSLNTSKSTDDMRLTGSRPVPGLNAAATSTPATPVTVTVPSNTTLGLYYLLACADDTNAVAETEENNNCKASSSKVQVTQ